MSGLPSNRCEYFGRCHRGLDEKGNDELWGLLVLTKGKKYHLIAAAADDKKVTVTEIAYTVKEQMLARKLEKIEVAGGGSAAGAALVWYKQTPLQQLSVTGWFPHKIQAKMQELATASTAAKWSFAETKALVEATIAALATPPKD